MRYIYLIIGFLCTSGALAASVDPQTAVNLHNSWRNALNQGNLAGQPVPNPFIADMYWDASLAASAQEHSDKCVWQHSNTGGENLYAHTGSGSISDAVNRWAGEYTSYSYSSNASIDGEIVGHYTQVVWDDSLRVGCAKTLCSPIKNPDGSDLWTGTMYTCQYRNSGNVIGHKPYTISATPDVITNYTDANENAYIPLLRVGNDVYRVKIHLKSHEPSVFETLSYEKIAVNPELYPNIATYDGTWLILPQVTLEGTGNYYVRFRHIGDLDFELLEVREN